MKAFPVSWIVLCGLSILFAGCTTYDPYYPGQTLFERANATSLEEVKRKVSWDKPPAFMEGFAQGCDSGHACANNPTYTFTKDEFRYASDIQYKNGWDEGRDNCIVYHSAQHIDPLLYRVQDLDDYAFSPLLRIRGSR